MLPFAMDEATTTTIVYIFVWLIAFPAFVTALIAYAIVQARGESEENKERRRFRRPGG
jgi:phage shock protein PspC (stress-responsive transcriptional regulator)